MEKDASKSRKTTVITHQRDVAEFILAMTVELSELAYKNGLDSLTVAFDVAREAAETELSRTGQVSLNS
jgi:hypothetical protein